MGPLSPRLWRRMGRSQKQTTTFLQGRRGRVKIQASQKKGIKYTSSPGKCSVSYNIKYAGKLVNLSWMWRHFFLVWKTVHLESEDQVPEKKKQHLSVSSVSVFSGPGCEQSPSLLACWWVRPREVQQPLSYILNSLLFTKSDVTVQMKDAHWLTDAECVSSTFYVLFNSISSLYVCLVLTWVGVSWCYYKEGEKFLFRIEEDVQQ